MKNILREAEWKIERNFGENKKQNLPDEWIPIVDDDINDFLECLMFSVNQPDVRDLLMQYSSGKAENFLKFTPAGKALDSMGEKFKDRLLNALGIPRRKENWITGKEIEQFVKEQQETLNCFIYALFYEENTMQYGKFNRLGKITASLDSYLNSESDEKSKIFCVSTAVTQLTTVKILQYSNDKNHKTKYDYIFIKLDDLK